MRRTTAVALVLALALAGCTGDDEETTTTTTTAATSTTAAESTTTSTDPSDDTTTTVATADPADFAYVAVRVDNGPGATQYNLGRAEIIIEIMVEGGITRLTPLYRDDPPNRVGPVRSIRPVDADLLRPFRSLVVTSGGQPFNLQEMNGAGVIALGPTSGVLSDTGNEPPNHLATSAAGLVPSTGFGVPPTPFGTGEPPGGGDEVTGFDVEVSRNRTIGYQWAGDEWVRSQDGSIHQWLDDDDNPSDLTTDVVLILFANERSAGYADSAGFPVSDFDVIGGGEFTLASDGAIHEGRWQRDSLDVGWTLTIDGAEVGIPDGRLFLMVVPDDADVVTR
jgi:hypothetical protein